MVSCEFWQNRPGFVTGHIGFKGRWLATWLPDLGARAPATARPRIAGFRREIETLCVALTGLLRRLRAEGRRLATYGALAKGELLREMQDFTMLRWPLTDEIVAQQASYLREGSAFLVGVPRPRAIDAA